MEGQRRKAGGYPVTAYGMCNGLGVTTAEVLASLSSGQARLVRPPIELPFETVCGVVARDLPRRDLPPLHIPAASADLLITRIAAAALVDVLPAIARAAARWGRDRIGTIVGTSTGGLASTEAAYAEYVRTGRMPAWFDFAMQHPFHLVGEAVRDLAGVSGPTYSVSTACSSSAKAFGSAQRFIAAGICDAVIVGGVDTLCETTLRGFHALSVLSPVACRPFGADRQGINIGEGGAFLLIERAGEGPATLLGVGESADAHHMSSPDPEGRGALAAMTQALERAGLGPGDIDYVNAHGTGTAKNDAAEAIAIAALLGNGAPVASTKGYTGHLLGAGGATEAAFAVASIERGFVPASVGSSPLDPAVAIRVVQEPLAARVRAAISNSFAFGGSNASVVFGAPL
jgi:3-oxoacyl-[acyl-carrier-protein] synthase-1